jgi:hypothetical protein
MRRIIASCGIIVLAVTAAACGSREKTTIRRETVQAVPDDPVVVEKKTVEKTTTIQPGAVEQRTTETRETGD